MRCIAWVALLAAGCASSGPAGGRPAPKNESLYPLATGTTWTYVDMTGAQFTTRVERVTQIGEEVAYVLRGATVGLSDDRFEPQGDLAVIAPRAGVPHLVSVGEKEWGMVALSGAAVPLVQPDAARGKSWGGRFAGGGEIYNLKVVSGGMDDIGTPAGRFRALRVVEEWENRGEVKVSVENWYAEGVGIVRSIWSCHVPGYNERRQLDLRAYQRMGG
jgi:hypothetical protein